MPTRRISRLERAVAGAVAVVLVGLALVEPDILGAPFASGRALAFTLAGTALAALALVAMVRRGVPPVVRVVVLGVPFLATSWWLLSPFFVDDVVDDDFEVSIADAAGGTTTTSASPVGSTAPPGSTVPVTTAPPTTAPGPRLLGSGTFVGLAGHEGTGVAGFFELPDGSTVLRLEDFDIENGPDLRLYVVPGADVYDPGDGATDLGTLRGNVGDQTYELPADLELVPGGWTVLVWCEAFSVEFVAATVQIA